MKITDVTLSILRTELGEGVIPTRGAVDKLPQLVLVCVSTAGSTETTSAISSLPRPFRTPLRSPKRFWWAGIHTMSPP